MWIGNSLGGVVSPVEPSRRSRARSPGEAGCSRVVFNPVTRVGLLIASTMFAMLASQSVSLAQAQAAASSHPISTPANSSGVLLPEHAVVDQNSEALKHDAIRRLMGLTGADQLGQQALDSMFPQVRTVMSATIVEPKRRQAFIDEFMGKIRSKLTGTGIVDAIIPIYSRHLSQQDIQDLIQFYQSPAGRHFIAALPQISQESQAVGAEMGRKALLETLEDMSGEYPEIKKLLPPETGAPASSSGPGPSAPGGAAATPNSNQN